jgi:hypothetical protein
VDNYIANTEGDIEDIQPDTTEPITSKAKGKGNKMDILRDKIAEDMWKDYQQFINN